MLCGVILHCQGVGDDSSVPSCWWESSNSGLSHGSSLDSRKKELLPVNKKEAHAPERQPIYREIVDSLGMVVACLYSLGNSLGERFNLEVLERVKAYKDPIIYLLVEILHIILSHQEKKKLRKLVFIPSASTLEIKISSKMSLFSQGCSCEASGCLMFLSLCLTWGFRPWVSQGYSKGCFLRQSLCLSRKMIPLCKFKGII